MSKEKNTTLVITDISQVDQLQFGQLYVIGNGTDALADLTKEEKAIEEAIKAKFTGVKA